MADYPPAIQHLITAFRQLPSIGPRSAERLALHVLKDDSGDISRNLIAALREASQNVRPCKQCGFFAQEDLCEICADPGRESSLLCVVESASDVLAFEKSGSYRGLYHVLHGTLSPLDGIGPEELGIPALLRRIKEREIAEVVLGLSQDVKGETTSLYLARELKASGITATRLATGISASSPLEYVDSLTLSHALNNRTPL